MTTIEKNQPKRKGRQPGQKGEPIPVANLLQEIHKISQNPGLDPRDNLERLAKALNKAKVKVRAKLKDLALKYPSLHTYDVNMFLGRGKGGRITQEEMVSLIAQVQGQNKEFVAKEVEQIAKVRFQQYKEENTRKPREKEEETKTASTVGV